MAVYLVGTSHLAAKSMAKRTALFLEQAVELPYFNAFDEPLLSLPQLYRQLEHHIACACQQAGWSLSELKHIPIFLGSTAYVIADCEYRFFHQQPLPSQHSLTVISQYLAERYRTQVFNFVTSCTSSAQAIKAAYQALDNGLSTKALVIGFELFNRLTFEHFNAMHLLSADNDYLPLLKSDGIVLGEGIGCIALSQQANPHFKCEMLGVHSLTDHENLTSSSVGALEQLIQGILNKAALVPAQLNAVKAHAVGSSTDEIELAVLQTKLPNVPIILMKSYTGHSLGASGALESALLLDFLQNGKMPALPVIQANGLPLAHNQALKCGYYLNYFLGFGGSNVGWILKWNL